MQLFSLIDRGGSGSVRTGKGTRHSILLCVPCAYVHSLETSVPVPHTPPPDAGYPGGVCGCVVEHQGQGVLGVDGEAAHEDTRWVVNFTGQHLTLVKPASHAMRAFCA